MNWTQRSTPFLVVLFALYATDVLAVNADLVGTAASIGNAFTAGNHPEGSHFHSSNLDSLPPGNPPIFVANVAEVGGFFGDEEVRGVTEFALGGGAVDDATLIFDIFDVFNAGLTVEESGIDGLFGQGPYEGFIDIFPYAADGEENISDYEITPLTSDPILSLEVAPDTVQGGDSVSIDITDLYNDSVGNGLGELGFRLQMAEADADADAGAITFHNFRIQLNQAVIPEPSSHALLLCSLTPFVLWHRRRRN